MNTTVEPSTMGVDRPAPPHRTTEPVDARGDRPADAAGELETGLFLADLTVHWLPLLGRLAVYLLLGLAADNYEVGPHLLAGALFGDFAGYAATSLRGFRRAPVHTGSELALFTTLFAVWWARYPWPASTEDQALFCLAGFGTLVARLGIAGMKLASRRDDA